MNKLLSIVLTLIIIAIGIIYVYFFDAALKNGEWLDVSGFARIVIPDTFVYKSLIDDGFSIFTISLTGVKNAVGPAIIWFIALSDWYLVVGINGAIILATLYYVIYILNYFDAGDAKIRLAVICLCLMPTMIYYSVGALKELPTLLTITAFYYHYIRRHLARWILMSAIICVFRYQMIVVISLFIVIDKLTINPLRSTVLTLTAISMVYPIFNNLELLSAETTALYREESNSGIGGTIEYVRSNIPVLSAVAILIRVFQSIIEPIIPPPDSFWFFESSLISVLSVAYIISFFIMMPFFVNFISCTFKMFKENRVPTNKILSLYSLIILFVVFSGGFSFVHHRYLFPVTALVIIAGIIGKKYN